MWPYIIRFNTRALLILTLAFGAIFVFWYYLLLGSKDRLTNSSISLTNIDLKKLLIASIIASNRGGDEVLRIRKSNDLNQQSKGKTKEGVNDVLTQGDLSSHRAMVHSLSAAFPGLRIISEEHSSDEDNNIEIHPIHLTQELLYDDKYSKIPFGIDIPLSELTVWVDPLDATKEYSEGLTHYVTTMVCVARNGEPIIGVIHKPFSSETYWSWNSKHLSNNIISALKSRNTSNHSLRTIISRSHAGDNVQQFIESSLSKDYKNIEIITAAGSGFKTIELIKDRADAYIHKTLIKKWDICAPNAIINCINNAKMTTIDGQLITYNNEDKVVNEKGLLATIGQNHKKLSSLLKDNYKP